MQRRSRLFAVLVIIVLALLIWENRKEESSLEEAPSESSEAQNVTDTSKADAKKIEPSSISDVDETATVTIDTEPAVGEIAEQVPDGVVDTNETVDGIFQEKTALQEQPNDRPD